MQVPPAHRAGAVHGAPVAVQALPSASAATHVKDDGSGTFWHCAPPAQRTALLHAAPGSTSIGFRQVRSTQVSSCRASQSATPVHGSPSPRLLAQTDPKQVRPGPQMDAAVHAVPSVSISTQRPPAEEAKQISFALQLPARHPPAVQVPQLAGTVVLGAASLLQKPVAHWELSKQLAPSASDPGGFAHGPDPSAVVPSQVACLTCAVHWSSLATVHPVPCHFASHAQVSRVLVVQVPTSPNVALKEIGRQAAR